MNNPQYDTTYRPPGYGYVLEDNFVRLVKTLAKNKPIIMEKENVNHPKHYNSHPSGVECIDIVRYYDFNIGSAIKYLWRHGLKVTDNRSEDEMSIEDLKKAVWYIEDEIKMIEHNAQKNT